MTRKSQNAMFYSGVKLVFANDTQSSMLNSPTGTSLQSSNRDYL